MPLAFVIFVAFATIGSVHGLRTAEPVEVSQIEQSKPYWCEKSTFGASEADKAECGW